MNRSTAILVGLAFVALIGGLAAVNAIDPTITPSDRGTTTDPQTVEVSNESREDTPYEDSSIGLSFSFDEERYHLGILPSTSNEHVKTIVLTDIDAYEELIRSEIPREGPPTITIQVYRNPDREWALTWADSHSQESGIGLPHSEVTETVIGGAKAIRYTIDGLYPTDTAVVAHGAHVYVLSGAYLDENSPTRKDFEPLIRSIVFILEA